MVLSVSRRITTFALSLAMLGTSSGLPLWADYTINGGQSVTVDNVAGTPTSITESGNITINGILRGREVVAPGGALTGNGGHIVLTSTGGVIAIGSAGQINVNATLNGGNGGTLTLNGPVITVDGLLSANGLSTGSGGTINFVGDTININATANVQARGLTTSAFGGKIDMNATDQVNIANGAVLSSQGKTTAGSKNYIEIDGAGVNIHGLLNATGNGTDRGGRIKVTSTSAVDNIDVGTTGKLYAYSASGHGGEILLDGNIVFAGNGQVHTAANSKNGGTITITGASNRSFTLQNGGILYANGRISGSNSNGGTISISTGSVTLNQGYLKAEGSETSGMGGSISIQATNGNIQTGTGLNIWTTANSGGSINMNTTAGGGQINIGAGSWLRAQGDQTSTITLSSDQVTVAGTVEAGGYRDGDGGTLDINVNNNGDFLLSGAGILSARGGETVASDGGLITVDARDITLQNTGNIRAYGTQPGNAGPLGDAGRILLTATRNYTSGQDNNINARGTTVYSGGAWTDGYIGITAANNLTADGLIQTGGREYANGGGGGLRLQAGNTLTVASTSRLEASVSGNPGGWTGNGGDITLLSTGGSMYVNGGSAIVGGVERGLINAASGASGNGGNITFSAPSGSIYLNGVRLYANGVNLGGIIQVLAASGLIDVSGTSTFQSNGLGNSTQNKISLQANDITFSGTPTFNASSTTGRAGLIEIIENGAHTLGATGSFLVDGTATGGELRVRAGTLTSSKTMTITNSKVNLESTSGNLVVNNALTAGDISLTANNAGSGITVNAVALTSRYSNGDGGNVTLAANGAINLSGATSILAQRNTAGANGGNVSITSTNGAVTMTTSGSVIRSYGRDTSTDNKISISGTSINIGGQLDARGFDSTNTAGDITLTATNGTLTVSNTVDVTGGADASGGTFTAQTNAGGGVTVSAISANGGGGAAGSNRSGGTVTLTSNGGGVAMNGAINAQGYGVGQGGTLDVNATGGNIALNGGSDITVTADTTGNGGTVDFDGSGTYSQSNASHIYAYGGQGGTIDINTTGNLDLLGTNYLHAYATNTARTGGVIRLTSGGTLNIASSNAQLYTYGLSNASRNLIELTGGTMTSNGKLFAHNVGGGTGGTLNLTTTTGNMTVSGTLRARGNDTLGGAGGSITLLANTGAITLNNADLQANGYVKSNAYSGSGGSISINAAQSYYQTAGLLDVSGDRAASVQGLNGENDGGSVSITAGTSATFERGAGMMIDTRGADYGSGSNLNGGDGGDINIAAGGNVRFIGATNALFFDLSGGRGRSAGYTSGNGGSLIMTGGSLTLPGAGTGAANNFDVTGGASSKGSTPGIDGTATFNGILLF